MRAKTLPVLLLLLAATPALAAPELPYQGRLDQNGTPQSGLFDFRFQLFSTATGGTALWTGTHTGVTVVGGAFSVKLGSTAALPDSLLSLPQLFLEISVKRPADAYTLLKGRQQLLHVPYAASTAGSFRVNGTLVAGATADGGTFITDGGTAVTVVGPDENGVATAALKVVSPGGSVLIDGRGVETASGSLKLQTASARPVETGGPLTVNGAVTASNSWTKIYDGNYATNAASAIPIVGGRIYKILFNGLIVGNSDTRLLLRLNGNPSYRSYIVFDGDATGGEWETTGAYLIRSVYGRTCGVSGDFTLASGNSAWTHVFGNSMADDYNYGLGSGVFGSGRSAAWISNGNPTSFTLATAGTSYFSGHLIVYMVGP